MAPIVTGQWFRGLAIGLPVLLGASVALPLNYAGDVFNLDIWKLTIPLDDDGDGVADEVAMPTLRNFEDPDFFRLSNTGESILFRARSGGATASGSDSPRSQLCEIKKNTGIPASWGSNDGLVHNMTITLAFTAVPALNPRVVAAGIYAGDNDVFAVRLEGTRLLLTRNEPAPVILEEVYEPGTMFDLMIIIARGRVRVFYASAPIGEWPLEKNGLHFRAGCEVPSDSSPSEGAENDFGEVEIQKLYVTHKPE